MRLLCFQANQFRWESFVRTLEFDQDSPLTGSSQECLVVFAHAEPRDEAPEARKRVFRHSLKHIKWLANKRALRHIVLHSFAHLASAQAAPRFAQSLLKDLAERLTETGYQVACTPFGHSCSWDLSVHGEAMAKVYKEI